MKYQHKNLNDFCKSFNNYKELSELEQEAEDLFEQQERIRTSKSSYEYYESNEN
jgi:hypothetical protein